MRNIVDIAGKVYGNLTVIKFEYLRNNYSYWLCQCDCGKTRIIRKDGIIGRKQIPDQCRCNPTMGYGTKEYTAWVHLRQRCYNPRDKRYHSHGARGIKVCERWLNSFENFLSDVGYAPTKKHTIERNDNDGNYEPSNCRWATYTEQARNKRLTRWIEYNGQKKSLAQWCEELDLPYSTISYRILHGWDVARAFSYSYPSMAATL